MFNWLRGKPKCPVDPSGKQWIESRFTWLTNELGLDRLNNVETVVPSERFLPMEYHCDEEGINDLMTRVAGFMDVDPSTLRLSFYEDTTPQYEGAESKFSLGLYSESRNHFDISLEVHSLEDPVGVIATLAHEIGHVILIGQNRIDPDEEDQEELTDLLTVFLGLGIFSANAVLQESNWTEGNSSGWSVGKRGYLSMDMYGYALALYALARNTQKPSWASHLRPDVRAVFVMFLKPKIANSFLHCSKLHNRLRGSFRFGRIHTRFNWSQQCAFYAVTA